jgi:CRISPR/Cas system-associated exonuclease Cas4 (RecB family)
MIRTLLLWAQGGLLVVLAVWLVVAVSRNRLARQAAQLPERVRVVAGDLGGTLERLGYRGRTLRDSRWGLVGKLDLLLEGPGGLVPVEVKRVSGEATRAPARAHDSHVVQLGACFVLCAADVRVGQGPSEGWIRYVDGRGKILPGGEFRIPNTPELRATVLEVIRRMRVALQDGREVHRSHEAVGRCAHCSVRDGCGESLA